MHLEIVLLRPAGLRVGHLCQDQKIAHFQRGVAEALLTVDRLRVQQHVHNIVEQVVVQRVELFMVMRLRVRARPGVGIACLLNRAHLVVHEAIEPLREPAIRMLHFQQRIEPKARGLMNRLVLERKYLVHAH